MARARSASATRSLSTPALLLRRVPYSEADLVLTFFTEAAGKVSALARDARRSQRRFGGALEAMHTIGIRVDERSGAELMVLREATILVARRKLVANLDCIEAAGHALAWLRGVVPARTPEPELWLVMNEFLNALDEPDPVPRRELAVAGLRLLAAIGWGLDLDGCVRCGRARDPELGAFVDPAKGGLVCRACGGARTRLSAELLLKLRNCTKDSACLGAGDAERALDLVKSALRAHADL